MANLRDYWLEDLDHGALPAVYPSRFPLPPRVRQAVRRFNDSRLSEHLAFGGSLAAPVGLALHNSSPGTGIAALAIWLGASAVATKRASYRTSLLIGGAVATAAVAAAKATFG